MPQIIPIKELKNTAEISDMCHKSEEPIYVTKNGYGDMVIMSMENYENTMNRIAMYHDNWSFFPSTWELFTQNINSRTCEQKGKVWLL